MRALDVDAHERPEVEKDAGLGSRPPVGVCSEPGSASRLWPRRPGVLLLPTPYHGRRPGFHPRRLADAVGPKRPIMFLICSLS